jgi:hypothetical protein
MNTEFQNKDPKEKMLWEIAKKRASFKRHLITYVLVNIFIWAIWYFNGHREVSDKYPWPIWTTLGWGLGVAIHYFQAYISPQEDAVLREYEKLKNKK